MSDNKYLFEIKQELSRGGPGLCLAKWYEVSMHLESGHNHSCVHPRTHRVSEDEVRANYHALHNSQYKKSVRAEMLAGGRPPECNYCWNMEDVGDPDIIPDRVYFSSVHLDEKRRIGKDAVQEIIDLGPDHDFFPRSVEVSFSTTCNFKCSYCGPEVSSRWFKEIEKHGPYPIILTGTSINQMQRQQKIPIPDREYNPYIEAFWKWLPEAYPHIKILRVTGGEPLLIHHTFRLMDWVKANPRPDLELGINSNLGVPDSIFDRFVAAMREISERKSVGKLVVWTSCEATGDQCDYIRYGMNYQKWLVNLRRVLDEIPDCSIRIMTTYSALSVTSYLDFCRDIYELRRQYGDRIIFDTHTYLHYPKYLAIDILTPDFREYFQKECDFIAEMKSQGLATDHEVFQSQRQLSYFDARIKNPLEQLSLLRKDFFTFVDEYDYRRGTNFLETFPEFRDFYELCKNTIWWDEE